MATTAVGREPSPAVEAPAARWSRPVRFARRVGPPALELLALSAFVVARPLLAGFGASPESLVARGADWTDAIAFALVIVVVPVVLLTTVEVAVHLVAGPRARRVAHLGLVAGLAMLVVWQLVAGLVDWSPARLSLVGAVGGVVVGATRARFVAFGTFLRYCSLGAVVFLGQFLFMSPSSAIVLGGRHAPSAGVEVPADAAPVVLVVFDGLPTELLLDGEGHIDGELYPNLAGLAGDATWYRNHTTAAQITLEAVPAILSGTRPSADLEPALVSNYPGNLFTLLGDSHEVHGGEAITGLCPVTTCPARPGSPVGGMLRDAGRLWELQMTKGHEPDLIPYVFGHRLPRARAWIEAQDLSPGDEPALVVLHVLLPHPSWEYLPDGSGYRAGARSPAGLWTDTWSGWGYDVARQRHVLQVQASDMLLGELLDGLRDAGTYDESMVVVTADHGYGFTDGAPLRGVDEANVDEILWTPLIVKNPGQRAGSVDDSNVNSTDILPTIAAELGIDELPWEPDGRPLGTVERDPADKWVVDWEFGRLGAQGDDDVVHVDGVEGFARVLAADPVEGTGPLAVWRRTEYGGLVGRSLEGVSPGDGVGDGEVEVGDPLPGLVATVDGLATWDDVDAGYPPLELTAQAAVPEGARVAVTVDGVVAAVVPSVSTSYATSIIHALLWPGALHDGANEIGLHVVDGPVRSPVLHALDVVPK